MPSDNESKSAHENRIRASTAERAAQSLSSSQNRRHSLCQGSLARSRASTQDASDDRPKAEASSEAARSTSCLARVTVGINEASLFLDESSTLEPDKPDEDHNVMPLDFMSQQIAKHLLAEEHGQL